MSINLLFNPKRTRNPWEMVAALSLGEEIIGCIAEKRIKRAAATNKSATE